jgi:hypothetical protein
MVCCNPGFYKHCQFNYLSCLDSFTLEITITFNVKWISPEYLIYIQSPAWLLLRLKVLKRDKYICQACFVKTASEAHHVTYIRLFHELLDDLVSVCPRCHKIITRANRKTRLLNKKETGFHRFPISS